MTHPWQGGGAPPGHPRFGKEPSMRPVYLTLQQLKESSPSRKHGLSEEDEERWRRAAVNLIITAGQTLKMDHLAVVTALEFFHRFYAQHSMVTNDRFLMAMACMYLGGKVADAPKSCRDIIYAATGALCPTQEEARRLCADAEWVRATREAVERAERALVYRLGFRFPWTTVHAAVVTLLLAKDAGAEFTAVLVPGAGPVVEEARKQLSQTAWHLANQSTKVPLALQHPPEALAAGCVWMACKLLRLRPDPIRTAWQGGPWYSRYGVTGADLEGIAAQIAAAAAADVGAAEAAAAAAEAVKAEFYVPAAGRGGGGRPPGGSPRKQAAEVTPLSPAAAPPPPAAPTAAG